MGLALQIRNKAMKAIKCSYMYIHTDVNNLLVVVAGLSRSVPVVKLSPTLAAHHLPVVHVDCKECHGMYYRY